MKIFQLATSKKITLNTITIIAILVPFIKPASELMGQFDIIFDIYKVISCILILLILLFNKYKPSKLILAISAIQITFFISTVIFGGQIKWAIVQSVSIIFLTSFFDFLAKKNYDKLIKSVSILLVTMCCLTIISMFIFYPQGMYVVSYGDRTECNNFLLGFDNSSAFYFIYASTILLLYAKKCNNKKLVWLSLIFSIASSLAFLYVESITAFASCMLLTIYNLILIRKDYTLHLLKPKNALFVSLALFLLLLTLNTTIQPLQLIAQKTDKTASLNYRFTIWNNTISSTISNNILSGFGHEESTVTSGKIGIDHPHNIFLDLFYRGGMIAFGLFIYICIRADKNKKTNLYSNILCYGLLIYLLAAQMDYYNNMYFFYTIFVLIENIINANSKIPIEDKKLYTREKSPSEQSKLAIVANTFTKKKQNIKEKRETK